MRMGIYLYCKALSVLRGRLDAKLFAEIQTLVSGYKKAVDKGDGSTPLFPAGTMLSLIHQVCTLIPTPN